MACQPGKLGTWSGPIQSGSGPHAANGSVGSIRASARGSGADSTDQPDRTQAISTSHRLSVPATHRNLLGLGGLLAPEEIDRDKMMRWEISGIAPISPSFLTTSTSRQGPMFLGLDANS